MTKKTNNYKSIVREMRSVTPFLKNYDLRRKLTSGQKAAITRAYKDYVELVGRTHTVYKPKSKNNLKIAQQSSGHTKGGTRFNVAFVPEPNAKGKISVSGKSLVIKRDKVTSRLYHFDRNNMVKNPSKEIRRVLRQAQRDGMKSIRANAGNHFFPAFRPADDETADWFDNLTQEYKKTYSAWMTGFTGYTFTNQKSWNEYKREIDMERGKARQTRKRLSKYQRRRRKG